MPRLGNDRRYSSDDLRKLASWAHSTGRITDERLNLVYASLTLLELIEK